MCAWHECVHGMNDNGGPALGRPSPGDEAVGPLVHDGHCCSFLLPLTLLMGEEL